jgi:NarL family two-component system response regulator LiaR
MPEPITVMIVDDHEMVRNGAKGYLDAQPEIAVVAEAESGEEAVRLAREYVPDVVLMDLVMPGMDGVEATRKVKDISPRTQIIILTSFHEDEHIFPALQAGAISYLLKDVKAGELVEAIRRAAKGEGFTNQKIADDLVISIGTVKGHVSNILSKLHLTDRTQAAVYAWQEGIVRRE